jgi:hypothetical protein
MVLRLKSTGNPTTHKLQRDRPYVSMPKITHLFNVEQIRFKGVWECRVRVGRFRRMTGRYGWGNIRDFRVDCKSKADCDLQRIRSMR